MKPTKNRVYCKDCGRPKMLFETEKKAKNFIKFNKEDIEAESGYSPQRSYYCLFCDGWHTTSIKEAIGVSKNEIHFEKYLREKEARQAEENKRAKEKKQAKKKGKPTSEEVKNQIASNFENQVKVLDTEQKESFFTETIDSLNDEIRPLIGSEDEVGKEALKTARIKLQILYAIRKQHGFCKPNKRIDALREQELEKYRQWIEKSHLE